MTSDQVLKEHCMKQITAKVLLLWEHGFPGYRLCTAQQHPGIAKVIGFLILKALAAESNLFVF